MTNTITFTIPSAETLDPWNKGQPISDEQLNEIERFFSAMMLGSEALGERFSLATTAFRAEFHHAVRMKRLRAS